ncbi:MAG: T9SS type A sorting domain-containing protein [Chitinophagales bacterium]|nr:T9SS type A sorting domain-containing protein [Chitinophagales bacterium]
MRKTYTSFLLLVASFLLLNTSINAQRKYQKNSGVNKNIKTPFNGNSFQSSTNYQKTAADCDTVNTGVTWDPSVYGVSPSGGGGFVMGTNGYGDLEKAAFFNVSSLANNSYISGVFMAIAVANSNNVASLTKTVFVKVYDGDATNGPNNVLGSYSITLGDLKAIVDTAPIVEIRFTTPIAIPNSKNFFVSLDFSNLTWGPTVKDSIAVVSSDDGTATVNPYDNGGAWERWDDGDWYDVDGSWGLPVGLYIFPIVSSTTTGCDQIAPVTFTSFVGEKSNNGNILKWGTATETNNLGFELLRSVNGSDYTSIAFIPSKAESGNSNVLLQYTYTDKASNTNTYYKLKQLDKDGKYAYSNVVLVKGEKPTRFELVNIYPNPAKDRLKVTVTAPKATNATLTITDMTGRIVMQNNNTLTMGENNIAVNISTLNSGSYIIKLSCVEGCESSVQKFIKQ